MQTKPTTLTSIIKIVVRMDVGDTIIRYGEENLEGALSPFAAATRHNLQISAGVGFRF